MKKMTDFLLKKHRMLRSLPIFKQYTKNLHDCLTVRYMAPLSFIDQIRARQEFHIAKSIRRKLKKRKLILRQTDKSNVLHIGQASDYEQKVIEYRTKTHAYIELSSNPFDDVFYKVIRLLNKLTSTKPKLINEYQKSKIIPVRDKTELAYQYFIPKSHKVTKTKIS